jgi:predicted transcriptional regulator of viral defense system
MASKRTAPRGETREVWELVRRQHGVITRAQLLDLGLATGAIAYRLRSGRLHRVHHGVYAVGRPDLSRAGRWMAAVMSCGSEAVLSHRSAAALHGIVDVAVRRIEVTVPPASAHRRPALRVYRRTVEAEERTVIDGVPITTADRTLLDLAPLLSRKRLEAAVNAADKHDLVDPEQLRAALARYAGQRGVVRLRQLLDRHTFTLTASELEREFLPIARAAGLGQPRTGEWVNGFEVDFHWPDLGLVVETDGLRYHRTPATQARDRLRDQTHTAAGLTTLRFTHAQVRYEPRHVRDTLAAVARRLRPAAAE